MPIVLGQLSAQGNGDQRMTAKGSIGTIALARAGCYKKELALRML